MNDEKKKQELFLLGLEAYHEGNYFEAHEHWEDLWSDYYLEDRQFIQGLIQLSVSFVHLGNNNLKGAKSLMRKCILKFNNFSGIHRGINLEDLKYNLDKILNEYEAISLASDFNNDNIPELI